jgi:hypothetical protein
VLRLLASMLLRASAAVASATLVGVALLGPVLVRVGVGPLVGAMVLSTLMLALMLLLGRVGWLEGTAAPAWSASGAAVAPVTGPWQEGTGQTVAGSAAAAGSAAVAAAAVTAGLNEGAACVAADVTGRAWCVAGRNGTESGALVVAGVVPLPPVSPWETGEGVWFGLPVHGTSVQLSAPLELPDSLWPSTLVWGVRSASLAMLCGS